jgi:acyl carrier protein
MVNLERLRNVFRNSLQLPEDMDFFAVRYGETAGWDSVAHMGLVAEIEQAFDVMFTTEQVIDMSSFEKAQDLLHSGHGIDFSS